MNINPLETDIVGVIVAILYLFLFWLGYVLFLRSRKLLTSGVMFLSLLLFLFPFGVIILEQLVSIRSIPPDTYVYASIIQNFEKNYDAYSFGVKGYSLLNYLIFKLCFSRPFVYLAFNIAFYNYAILGVFCTFRNLLIKQFGVDQKFLITTQILALIYPIGINFSTSILRESTLLLIFSIAFGGIVGYKLSEDTSVNGKFIFKVVLPVLLVFLIRPVTAITLILLLLYILIRKNFRLNYNNIIKAIIGSVFILLLGEMLISEVYDLQFNISWLKQYRIKNSLQYGIEGYSISMGNGILSSFGSYMLVLFQYILSPLPVMVPLEIAKNKLIPLIDVCYLIVFIYIIPLFFFQKRFRFWYFAAFLMFLIPALFETNVSGAYRHRMNAVLILIPLSAYLISRMRIKIGKV